MALLIIFISMLLAWNVIDQPNWCKEFWEWCSTVWSNKSKKVEVEVEEEKA